MTKKTKVYEIISDGKKYEIYDVSLKNMNDRKIVSGKIKCGSKIGKFTYDISEGDFDTDYREDSDEDIFYVLEEFGNKHFYENKKNNEYLFSIK